MFTTALLVAGLAVGQPPTPAAPPAGGPGAPVLARGGPSTLPNLGSVVPDIRGSVGNPDTGAAEDKAGEKEEPYKTPARLEGGLFPRRFLRSYYDTFMGGKNPNWDAEPGPNRDSPAVFSQPPFALSQHLGPAIGAAPDTTAYPLMQALYGGPFGDQLKQSRIRAYGWVDAGMNYSSSRQSNVPTAYAIVPNRLELDQAILRIERVLDTAQTDHWDWGFRMTNLYGIDYRYTTAQGYFSQQLLNNNHLNGYDPLELFAELYIPDIMEGFTLRVGRYISPPDIEAQLAPDNYLYTHSLLFTYDAYTHTGFIGSLRLDKQWTVQAGMFAGTDIAPWTNAAVPTFNAAVRWVSEDQNDSVYLVANSINDGQYRAAAGHDNLNYVVANYTHRFNERLNTYFETYYMWQFNALKGGTVNNGPVEPFGGGGGPGPLIPGRSQAYGVVNYTNYKIDKQNYVTFRNEWWNDE
ncbi:MAG TPA: outer membrane beta-barrel protein, partial [Urbifossiella sp.]|nr:outer membrane beta-barrel protein [Urbifossiella sp.]